MAIQGRINQGMVIQAFQGKAIQGMVTQGKVIRRMVAMETIVLGKVAKNLDKVVMVA